MRQNPNLVWKLALCRTNAVITFFKEHQQIEHTGISINVLKMLAKFLTRLEGTLMSAIEYLFESRFLIEFSGHYAPERVVAGSLRHVKELAEGGRTRTIVVAVPPWKNSKSLDRN